MTSYYSLSASKRRQTSAHLTINKFYMQNNVNYAKNQIAPGRKQVLHYKVRKKYF